MKIKTISKSMIDHLTADSRISPRRRLHLNLHADHAEPVQRLLNAIQMDSYIRPHRHALDPKTESLFAITGQFMLMVFDEGGRIMQRVLLGYGGQTADETLCAGVELPPGTWHTVLALQPDSVLLELKAGPFDPGAAKEYAPWAPEEGSEEGRAYLDKLHQMLGY